MEVPAPGHTTSRPTLPIWPAPAQAKNAPLRARLACRVTFFALPASFRGSAARSAKVISASCASLSAMNAKHVWFLLALAFACLMGVDAVARSPKDPPTLVGTWDYTSMAVLTNGRPSGTVHFKPGQWTVTFNQDGTWVMKPPSVANPHSFNG